MHTDAGGFVNQHTHCNEPNKKKMKIVEKNERITVFLTSAMGSKTVHATVQYHIVSFPVSKLNEQKS